MSKTIGKPLMTTVKWVFLIWCMVFAMHGAWAQEANPDAAEPAQETQEQSTVAEDARALIAVLRDQGARQALIDELERLAGPADSQEAQTKPQSQAEPSTSDQPDVAEDSTANAHTTIRGLATRIADITRGVVNTGLAGVEQIFVAIDRIGLNIKEISALGSNGVLDKIRPVLLTILATIAVFVALRWVLGRAFRAIGTFAAQQRWLVTLFLSMATTLLDVLIVVLAWGVGYGVAAFLGDSGSVSLHQTLYLNAFFLVEMAKVVVRMIVSPSSVHLRLISIPDHAARSLNRALCMIISILGYGQMFLVPLIGENATFSALQAVTATVSLLALMVALVSVLWWRRPVGAWLGEGLSTSARKGVIGALIRFWHWPVVLYLIVLSVVVVTRPGNVLFPMLIASAHIALAIILGMMVIHMLRRATRRGVVLPESVQTRLPMLEHRLNTFVPKFLLVLRLITAAVVLGVTLHAMGVFDFTGFLDSQTGGQITGALISVLGILFCAFLVWLAFSSWVDYRLNPDFGRVPSSREHTLLSLLRNAVTIMLIVFTLMFSLSEIGIDIAPLLASAGVLGLAIGFGAQKLVQDIITGIFIQFENAINVGDVVTLAGVTGTAERLTIRSVSLRDVEGALHLIPFSSVDMVSNFMKGFSYYLCDMGVGYREDIDFVRQAMFDAFDELKEDPAVQPFLLGNLDWLGLNAFGDNAVVLRARIKTLPGKQWGVGRLYNRILKRIFDERNIEIPFPHQTIYFGEDRSGGAPAARIVMTQTQRDAQNADTHAPSPGAQSQPDVKNIGVPGDGKPSQDG